MRITDLPSLRGTVVNSNRLTSEVAKAISSVQVYRRQANRDPQAAALLHAFFLEAAEAVAPTTADEAPDETSVDETPIKETVDAA